MQKVMVSLKMMYPSKFDHFYPTDDSKQAAIELWVRVLQGVPENIVLRAVSECPARFAWVPDISEFLALCKSLIGSDKVPWFSKTKKTDEPRIENTRFEKQIQAGANVVEKIMRYFPEIDEDRKGGNMWSNRVLSMLVKAQEKGKLLFPGLGETEVLEKLNEFSEQDYHDLLDG